MGLLHQYVVFCYEMKNDGSLMQISKTASILDCKSFYGINQAVYQNRPNGSPFFPYRFFLHYCIPPTGLYYLYSNHKHKYYVVNVVKNSQLTFVPEPELYRPLLRLARIDENCFTFFYLINKHLSKSHQHLLFSVVYDIDQRQIIQIRTVSLENDVSFTFDDIAIVDYDSQMFTIYDFRSQSIHHHYCQSQTSSSNQITIGMRIKQNPISNKMNMCLRSLITIEQ